MILNAYYFRHHMYTLVPRHVRDDMSWMADAGTNVVTIAVLEQDLYAAKSNMDIVCKEADRVGMSVHAVPSRWGGIVAGAPKVPSYFSITHPDTWILGPDNRPRYNGVSGTISSVHHEATIEFFRAALHQLLREWPFAGIVWDEPKSLHIEDFSPAARAVMPADAGVDWHTDAVVSFFANMSAVAKQIRPEVLVSMFLYSNLGGHAVERCAQIPDLDYFGCDGRPWRLEDGGQLEGKDKVLLGQAERFIAAAKKNGKEGLILIENHNMPLDCYDIMDRRLPEVLSLGAGQVIYYYYPRNLDDPDRAMGIIARHLKGLSGGPTK